VVSGVGHSPYLAGGGVSPPRATQPVRARRTVAAAISHRLVLLDDLEGGRQRGPRLPAFIVGSLPEQLW